MNAPIKFAQCCKPIKGDAIAGFITRGRGVTIHRDDCPTINRWRLEEPNRIVNASWDASAFGSQTVDIDVISSDRSGLLKDVLDVLDRLKKSALKVEANVSSSFEAHIYLRFEVRNQDEYQFIKDALLEIRDVKNVVRQGARA